MFRAPKRTDYTSKRRMSDACELAFDPRGQELTLILGEILVDSDQSEHLSAGSLKVEVRVRYRKHLHAEVSNLTPDSRDVVGLELQVDRLQEVVVTQRVGLGVDRTLVGLLCTRSAVEKRNVVVVSDLKVILVAKFPAESAAQNVTVESADSLPFSWPYSKRRVVAEGYFCHGYSFRESAPAVG